MSSVIWYTSDWIQTWLECMLRTVPGLVRYIGLSFYLHNGSINHWNVSPMHHFAALPGKGSAKKSMRLSYSCLYTVLMRPLNMFLFACIVLTGNRLNPIDGNIHHCNKLREITFTSNRLSHSRYDERYITTVTITFSFLSFKAFWSSPV